MSLVRFLVEPPRTSQQPGSDVTLGVRFVTFMALSELLAFLQLPSEGKLNTHQFY